MAEDTDDKPKWRYRTHWAGYIILQIGESKPVNHDPADPRDTGPKHFAMQWRDACVEDLLLKPEEIHGS